MDQQNEGEMMDVVERLRDTASKGISVWGDLQMEAAKEIEILAAEGDLQRSTIAKMQEEIDRLQEKVAPAALDGAVPAGSWEYLKLMMQHSAWEDTLQLCDALANIDDFAAELARAGAQKG